MPASSYYVSINSPLPSSSLRTFYVRSSGNCIGFNAAWSGSAAGGTNTLSTTDFMLLQGQVRSSIPVTVPEGAVSLVHPNARFTYAGYVPGNNNRFLFARTPGGRTFPISVVSRSGGALTGSYTEIGSYTGTPQQVYSSPGFVVFRFNAAIQTGALPFDRRWIGKYFRTANNAGVVVRNIEYSARSGALYIAFETAPVSFDSNRIRFYEATPWSCILDATIPFPFEYVNAQGVAVDERGATVAILSMNVVDRMLVPYAFGESRTVVSNEDLAHCVSDKLRITTDEYAQPFQPTLYNPSGVQQFENLSDRSLVAWYDGNWNFYYKGPNQLQLRFTVYSGTLRVANLSDAATASVVSSTEQTVVLPNNSFVSLETGFADLRFANEGTEACYVRSPQNSTRRYVAPSGGRFYFKTPTGGELCVDTKPGVRLGTSHNVLAHMLRDEVECLDANNGARANLVSKFETTHINPALRASVPDAFDHAAADGVAGAIFTNASMDTFGLNYDDFVNLIPIYHSGYSTNVGWLPEPFSGYVVGLNSGSETQGANVGYEATRKFYLFGTCFWRNAGGYWHTNSYTEGSLPLVYQSTVVNKGKWKLTTESLYSSLSLAFGSVAANVYKAFVPFVTRERQINAPKRHSKTARLTISAYKPHNLNATWGSQVSHLLTVGRPSVREDGNWMTRRYIPRTRQLWWDGDSWNLKSFGGGDMTQNYRAGWAIDEILLRTAGGSATTGEWRTVGDAWTNISLSDGSSIGANSSTYYKATSTVYHFNGDINVNGTSLGSRGLILLGGDGVRNGQVSPEGRVLFTYPSNTDDLTKRIPYFAHIGHLVIKPTASGYLTLRNSRHTISPGSRHIHLGKHSIQFADNRNPGFHRFIHTDSDGQKSIVPYGNNNNYPSGFNNLDTYGEVYFDFHQPEMYLLSWVPRSDLARMDGRRVRLGAAPLDSANSVVQNAGPQDYLYRTQRDRATRTGSTQAAEISSEYQFLREMDWFDLLVLPYSFQAVTDNSLNYYLATMSEYSVLTNNLTYGTLESRGLCSVIETQTKELIELFISGVAAKCDYAFPGGGTIGRVTAGQIRKYSVQVTNTSAIVAFVPAGQAVLKIAGVQVAVSSQGVSLDANSVRTFNFDYNTNSAVPAIYGAQRVTLELTDDNGNDYTLTLDAALIVQRQPQGVVLLPSTKPAPTDVFRIDNDIHPVTGVRYDDNTNGGRWNQGLRYYLDQDSNILNGWQQRVTAGHANVAWRAIIKHYGDSSYADLEYINVSSSYLATSPATWYGASLKDTGGVLDKAHLRFGEEARFVTGNEDQEGSDFRLRLSYYNNGVLDTCDVYRNTGSEVSPGTNSNANFYTITLQSQPSLTADGSNLDFGPYGSTFNFPSAHYIRDGLNGIQIFGGRITNQGQAFLRAYGLYGFTNAANGTFPDPGAFSGEYSYYFNNSAVTLSGDINNPGNVNPAFFDDPKHLYFLYIGDWGQDYTRDQNGAYFYLPHQDSGATPRTRLNAKPVYFFGAASVSITNLQQTSDGKLRGRITFNSGIASSVNIRLAANKYMDWQGNATTWAPALVTWAQGDTDLGYSYGYASPDPNTNFARVTGSYFVANNPTWNPSAGVDDAFFHWQNIPTLDLRDHWLDFEIDLNHYMFQGGNDNRCPSSGTQYPLGVQSKRGVVDLRVKLESASGATIPISESTIASFTFSYAPPVINAPADNPNYGLSTGSFVAPGYTLQLPQGGSASGAQLAYSFDGVAWVNINSGATVNYTIPAAQQNSWAGIYLRCRDGYGNVGYRFHNRPHDTDTPSILTDPYLETGVGGRTVLGVASGASRIFVGTSHFLESALKEYYLRLRINGVEQGQILGGSILPSLRGKWLVDMSRLTGDKSRAWNFYNETQFNSLAPTQITLGTGGGDENFRFCDSTGTEMQVLSLLEDVTIGQKVLKIDNYWWDGYLEYQEAFSIKPQTEVYSDFILTMKVPTMMASEAGKRLNGRAKVKIEITVDGQVFERTFQVIDDGQYHTYVWDLDDAGSIIPTNGNVSKFRLWFTTDNGQWTNPSWADIYAPVRPAHDIRIANMGFLPAATARYTNVFMQQFNIPAINGDDYLQIALRAVDFAGREVTRWNPNLVYVPPLEPTAVNLKHVSVDGQLRAGVASIVTAETASNVLYQIGYNTSPMDTGTSLRWLDGGNLHTKAQWESGFYSDPLEQGQTYYVFAIAYNPNNLSVRNPIGTSRIYTPFQTGYLFPVPYDASHHSDAMHDSAGNHYTAAVNRMTVAYMQDVWARAFNTANRASVGPHYRSRWNPYPQQQLLGTTLRGSTNHSFWISFSNFKKTGDDLFADYPIHGYVYSISYGVESRFNQPTLADSDMPLSGSVRLANVNFDANYRGYAYIHVRPYYQVGLTKTLLAEQFTYHQAVYLEIASAPSPISGLLQSFPMGYGMVNGLEPETGYWSSAIYRMAAEPDPVQGFLDPAGVERNAQMKYRLWARKKGTTVALGPAGWSAQWTDGTRRLTRQEMPQFWNLEENTSYDFRLDGLTEGGCIYSGASWEMPAYTHIRPMNKHLSVYDITSVESRGGVMRINFGGLPSEKPTATPNGKYVVFDYLNCEIVGTIPFAGQASYSVDVPAEHGRVYGLVLIPTNQDGYRLDEFTYPTYNTKYPFNRHLQSSLRYSNIFAYMHPLTPPSVRIGLGYGAGTGQKSVRVIPGMENHSEAAIYTGDLLSPAATPNYGLSATPGGTYANLTSGRVFYNVRVWRRHIETGATAEMGYMDFAGGFSSSPVFKSYDEIVASGNHFTAAMDLAYEWGFSIRAVKYVDLHDQEVMDTPQGDIVYFSEWSNKEWTRLIPTADDDYKDLLHLYTKFNRAPWETDPSITSCSTNVLQDISSDFETLRDLRASYKVLASETTVLEHLDERIINALKYKSLSPENLAASRTQDLPYCHLVLAVLPMSSRVNIPSGFGLYTSLWNNITPAATHVGYSNGDWIFTDIGVLDRPNALSLHDEYGGVKKTSYTRLMPDTWYHVRWNAYDEMTALLQSQGWTWADVDRVRVAVGVGAVKGTLYGNFWLPSDIRWDVNLRSLEETQIGILLRNLSIGWTEQVDAFGQKLYTEDAWDGAYTWRIANASYRFNAPYGAFMAGLGSGQFVSQSMPPKYQIKDGPYLPDRVYNYDNAVKGVMDDHRTGMDWTHNV